MPAIVIGRSYGGEIATDLALRYPDHVRALILLEGASSSLSPKVVQAETEMAARVISSANRGLAAVGETLLREVLGDASWETLDGQMKAAVIDNGPAILAELRGGGLKVDAATLQAIDKPTLLVSAVSSEGWLKAANDAMQEAIPGAQTDLVAGGHLIDPADPVVLNFIRVVVARTATARG